MRILFLGDLVGRSGREAAMNALPTLKKQLKPDFTIVNCENAAHGFGVTTKICDELFDAGIDCLTTGNHVWDQREIVPYLDREKRILRPINYPKDAPGQGAHVYEDSGGRRILVVNAMGRLFMELMDDPFAAMDTLLKSYGMGRNVQAIFLDFHAEATAEKAGMAHHLDGRVSCVVGTHTHVPTADQQVLPGGTAFQTDAGMCGDYNSMIGMSVETALYRFTKKVPKIRLAPAEGEATVCGLFVETDDQTGFAKSVAPVRHGGRLEQTVPS